MSGPTSNPTAVTKQRADNPSPPRIQGMSLRDDTNPDHQAIERGLPVANPGDQLDQIIRPTGRHINSIHRRAKGPEQPDGRCDRRGTNRYAAIEKTGAAIDITCQHWNNTQ
ncbi:MAG: hypothetical protein OES24_21690, partial [Acidimicrobiia bacterium]|nr:hypothetical protein [Acidimicrobiia bacterium]